MPGRIVEAAYKYAKVAAMVRTHGSLGQQSEVNAAIAVELLLKSIRARPVKGKAAGTVDQRYQVQKAGDGHDLLRQYRAVPAKIRRKLDLDKHEATFREKRNIFKLNRYEYEASASGTFDDDLLHLAAELIPRFVQYFLDAGSDDPWLRIYQAESDRFSLPCGISFS